MSTLTGRDYFMYLLGSITVAAILCIGAGLVLNTSWRAMIGMTMMLSVFLYGLTISNMEKKQ